MGKQINGHSLKFIFRNRFIYLIAQKVGGYINRYLNKVNRLHEADLQKEWESRFANQEYFRFHINDRVEMRLFRDSKLSELIYFGFEKQEQLFLSSVLNKGDYFIDIGANIGLFTLIAAEIVGRSGRVIAFEPTPETYRRLLGNIELNKFDNIDAYSIGLSNSPQKLKFNISSNGYDAWNSFANSVCSNLQEQIDVNVSTLDLVLGKYEKSKIKLVKIDAEGWEKFILQGGTDFLSNYSPQLLVEFTEQNTFDAGYMVQEIYDYMVDLGYMWYRIDNGTLIKVEKQLHYPYENLVARK
jgi:FkbM family methyltransferase